jgi:hypothetical protein
MSEGTTPKLVATFARNRSDWKAPVIRKMTTLLTIIANVTN